MQRKKGPLFAPWISMQNICHAMDVITSLNYSGPLTMGTDDTAIEKALQAYQGADGSWFIVGGCGEPLLARPPQSGTIKTEDDLDVDILDLLRDSKILHADKARVIILSIPIPKVSASVTQDIFIIMGLLISRFLQSYLRRLLEADLRTVLMTFYCGIPRLPSYCQSSNAIPSRVQWMVQKPSANFNDSLIVPIPQFSTKLLPLIHAHPSL